MNNTDIRIPDMPTLTTPQLYMLYIVSVVLGSIANIIYICLLISYFKQGCLSSTKKGMNLLMCLTLIIHNSTLYCPLFLDVIDNPDPQSLAPSLLCITVASLQHTTKLLTCSNFALVFFYTYMVLYHTDCIMNHHKLFFAIFIGFFWSIGIIFMVLYFFLGKILVRNNGECESKHTIFAESYILYFLITAFIQLFSIIKIYLKIRNLDDNDTDRKNKRKLYILGIIEFAMSMIVPLFFIHQYDPYVSLARITLEIVKSLVFITFYAYDEETIATLKELFLCKKPELLPDEATLLTFKEMN